MNQVPDVGDVVQIDPAHDERFGGCFMLVTEPKPPWGAMGFVRNADAPKASDCFYRVPIEAIEVVGVAEWVPREDGDL